MRIFSCALNPREVPADEPRSAAFALEDGSVQIWRISSKDDSMKELVKSYENVHGGEEALRTSWSPDGSRLLSGGGNGTLCLFGEEGDTRQTFTLEVSNPEDTAIYSCWFGDNSKKAFVAYENRVSTIDLETGKVVWTASMGVTDAIKGPKNPSGSRLVFDACENTNTSSVIAALADGSIGIADINSPPKRIRFRKLHESSLTSCSLSSSQNDLVVASTDGTASVWDVRTWDLRFRTARDQNSGVMYGARFSPRDNEPEWGDRILTWSGESLNVWRGDKLVERSVLPFEVLCWDEHNNMILACGEQPDSDDDHDQCSDHSPHQHGLSHGGDHCHSHGDQHEHVSKDSKRTRFDLTSAMYSTTSQEFWGY